MIKLRTISGQEPIRVGVLLNARARFNRHRDIRSGASRLLGAGRVVETTSLDELSGALARLLNEQRVNVLAICGGDGTMHHVINQLLREYQLDRPAPSSDRDPPSIRDLPALLTLRGGTLNMLARALRADHDPLSALHQFQQRYLGASVGALIRKPTRLIQIDGIAQGPTPDGPTASASLHERPGTDAAQPPRFGFIFGSEMTARCLALYDEEFGGGYRALATFLRSVFVAFLTRNQLWQRHRYLFEGEAPWATVWPPPEEAQREALHMPYRALVAATIDIGLFGGWVVGLRASHGASGTMRLRLLKEQPARQIIANLHTLMFGQDAEGILDIEAAPAATLACNEYSVDGEVFAVPRGCEGVRLSVPDWSLPFVGM